MNSQVKRLTVKYNGRIVGYLQELMNKQIGFQYDKDWLDSGFSLSPFSLPLNDKVFISKSEYFNGLFGVFNDSLPDGWGELLVRRMLMKKGINYDKLSGLTRLSLIRDNGLGALTYEPTQASHIDDFKIDLDALAEEVKHILDNNNIHEDFDIVFALGGASGGARPKVHIEHNHEYWIVKFPSSFDPKNIGDLEYKANELAKLSHINVNEFKLFPSKKTTGYFGAKRFDRLQYHRIHMISLSSLLETTHKIPNLDYVHLFQVIQKICVDQKDIYEAYKRMCFNVLYPNRDDHGKNFAFIYDEEKKGYKLSPFYDITQTKDKLEHEMTVLGEGRPNKEDLLSIVNEFNLSKKKCNIIIDRICNVISSV